MRRSRFALKIATFSSALFLSFWYEDGEGGKLTRDLAYASAMENIYRDYPDDLEAAAFYSLSLLGTVRPGDKGFQRRMKASAIALEVYQTELREAPKFTGIEY